MGCFEVTENMILSFDNSITPEEYINLMFERTDEDGILYIPWDNGTEKISCRCKIDWNLSDLEKIQKRFKNLYSELWEIGRLDDKLSSDPVECRKALGSDKLFETWNTYVRPFNTETDYGVIYEIGEKHDIIHDIKKISQKIIDEKPLDEDEQSLIKENIHVNISKDERKYYDTYREDCFSDAEKRIGNNICAYSVIIRAKRVCKLISLSAPQFIIDYEARCLASAMVLHEFGKSKEEVNDNIRLQVEKIERMSDEELDKLYRPKKTNTRKSMAPLYVYQIIKEYSSPTRHLRQKDILEHLSKYPYEISLERKALSRILHNLMDDSNLFVHSDADGVWIE